MAHLEHRRTAIEDDGPDPTDLVKQFVDKALGSSRAIDRTFWLLAADDVINEGPLEDHPAFLPLAARRIHATSSVPHQQRLAATRFLFAKVVNIG